MSLKQSRGRTALKFTFAVFFFFFLSYLFMKAFFVSGCSGLGLWVQSEVKLAGKSFDEIEADPALKRQAVAYGQRIFEHSGTTCTLCHGQKGEGAPRGCPPLNDPEWIWGGTNDAIYRTIKYGIRQSDRVFGESRPVPDPQSRWSAMPRFDTVLSENELNDVTAFVYSLSEGGPDNAQGRKVFGTHCASCHGNAGEGKTELGVPSLQGPYWTQPFIRDNLKEYIRVVGYITTTGDFSVGSTLSGFNTNSMPRHPRFSDADLKAVTLYVRSLSDSQK